MPARRLNNQLLKTFAQVPCACNDSYRLYKQRVLLPPLRRRLGDGDD